MPKQELLPPQRVEQVTTRIPTVHVGGPVTSAIERFVWDRQSKAVDALTRLNNAELALYQSQTQLINQARKREQELFEWQEDREKFAHGLQVRRVERADAYRQAQHTFEVGEMRRTAEREHYEKEIVNAKTILTLAQVALVDAEQQLSAQRELGELSYRIAHKKKQHELLDLDMLEADKRALLDGNSYDGDGDEAIDAALARYRQDLAADNLDTTQLDAVIRARRR
jgi:hypothetical protein